MNRIPGRIIVLAAPSGSGKTSIAARLLGDRTDLRFSVSATTRSPRGKERPGKDYHFISVDDFKRLISENAFAEYEEVYPGRFYGTLRAEIDGATPEAPVLLDVDVRGALSIKDLYGEEALLLFIKPPSLEVLEERLRKRGTETPESLTQRINKAAYELSYESRFDRVVVNDDLERAGNETLEAVRAFLRR
jgi:guanylate kinase